MLRDVQEIYFLLLMRFLFTSEQEEALVEALDFGISMMKHDVMPEDVTEMHHLAMLRISDKFPDLLLRDVAGQMMVPFMEASMAYSLALREERERKLTLRNQNIHAARLEAVGTMAAGIAHDFNTILGVVSGYAELLTDELPIDSSNYGHARQIMAASSRARDLVARMLAFARALPITPVLVDAVSLVEKVLRLIKVSLQSTIHVTFTSDLEHAYLLADPSQLEQIVMNLCMNAADAMEGRGNLEITISQAVSLFDYDGSERARMCLTVTDDGCGMSQRVQNRILDPFYTTKEPGKGSGLGLSVIYGIVTDLQGEILIDSETGVGSRFRIILLLATPSQRDAGAGKEVHNPHP